MIRHVFLCHASEDKEEIARPLRVAMSAAGISCWIDEAEIRWGDSIVDKINVGLRDSRFVMVILSTPFLKKPWPRGELAAALAAELSAGETRVLPLLVGGREERRSVLDEIPLLKSKFYLVWEGDPAPILEGLKRRLGALQVGMSRMASEENADAEGLYCQRCGAKPGSPTQCSQGFAYHSFTGGTGKEYCQRCGAKPGSPTQCSQGFAYHSFTGGTGKEHCGAAE